MKIMKEMKRTRAGISDIFRVSEKLICSRSLEYDNGIDVT